MRQIELIAMDALGKVETMVSTALGTVLKTHADRLETLLSKKDSHFPKTSQVFATIAGTLANKLERPKSAPYLRLKIAKGPRSDQVFSSTEDPSRLFIHSVANHQTN